MYWCRLFGVDWFVVEYGVVIDFGCVCVVVGSWLFCVV